MKYYKNIYSGVFLTEEEYNNLLQREYQEWLEMMDNEEKEEIIERYGNDGLSFDAYTSEYPDSDFVLCDEDGDVITEF